LSHPNDITEYAIPHFLVFLAELRADIVGRSRMRRPKQVFYDVWKKNKNKNSLGRFP
jgi:hypothetical protein